MKKWAKSLREGAQLRRTCARRQQHAQTKGGDVRHALRAGGKVLALATTMRRGAAAQAGLGDAGLPLCAGKTDDRRQATAMRAFLPLDAPFCKLCC